MSRVRRRIRALHLGLITASARLDRGDSPDPRFDLTPIGRSLRSSVDAHAPRWPASRRNGQHDDAKREHRETHEFKYQRVHGNIPPNKPLALQLPFLKISESMGNHDSKIVDADSVD